MSLEKKLNIGLMVFQGIASIILALALKIEWEVVLLLQSCWLIPTLFLVRWSSIWASLFVYCLVNSVAFYAVYALSALSWELMYPLIYTMGMYTSTMEIHRKDGAQVEVAPSGVGDGA